MSVIKSNSISLKDIILKAQSAFLRNPLNEEAKNLFIKAFKTQILKEDEEKFDLFGMKLDPKEEITKQLESSELIQRSVEDPSFGMKAAMCLGEATDFQKYMIKYMEDMGFETEEEGKYDPEAIYEPYEREKGQIDTGQPGTEQKIGEFKGKYAGVLKDLWKASFQGSKISEKTSPIVIARDITSHYWVPFNRAKMANAISSNTLRGTITPEGAGELEFLARMYYSASKGLNETISIPSAIKMQPGVSREMAQDQENFLLNLGGEGLKSKIADRCKSILEVYMILVVEKVLQPILKFENVQEYAYEGVQQALNKLIGLQVTPRVRKKSKGVEIKDEDDTKYDFEHANIGAWTYTVVRNYAIDQLKGFTKLVFDNSKAAEWANGLSYPYELMSKVKTDDAKGSFEKSRKVENKKTGKTYYFYTYNDRNSLFNDLQMANGFSHDVIEKGEDEETRGRKAIYQPNNPLYFKNLSDTMKGNFMTSVKDYMPSQEETETQSQIEKRYIDNVEKKQAELLAAAVVNNNKKNLLNISKEIIEKIIQEPDNKKYGQKDVIRFIEFNKDLASAIVLRLFGYGIYKFVEKESVKERRKRIASGKNPEGTYDWMTKPELYFDDFLLSLQDLDYLGQDLPAQVTNRLGKVNMPIRQFVQLLKKVVLGSGTEGREIEKYFKAGQEGSEEFKQLVKSGGFLLKNPTYLRRVYSLLSKLPAGTELGGTPQARLDENINKIKILIKELKSEFNNYEKNLINNINIK